MSAAGPLLTEIATGQYEAAALRLLVGVLTAWRETSPGARDALIALLARDAGGAR